MKRFFIIIGFAFMLFSAKAQVPHIDSLAVYILDRMSTTIGSLESCSFTTCSNYDVWREDLGYIKHTDTSKSSIQFPDKMKISSLGDKGHRAMWYDGTMFSYYSFDKNQYAYMAAPESITQVFDSISKGFGIEFPGADFFYPSFLEDLVSTGGNLIYLGITKVGDKNCFHIAGKDIAGTGFQFWIEEGEYFLPVKMIITYTEETGHPQYEALYSNWELNPILPSSLFEFVIPPTSAQIKMKELTR